MDTNNSAIFIFVSDFCTTDDSRSSDQLLTASAQSDPSPTYKVQLKSNVDS